MVFKVIAGLLQMLVRLHVASEVHWC